PESGQTLPDRRYLEHPPTYIPPSPRFPLPQELATLEAQAASPMPPKSAPTNPGTPKADAPPSTPVVPPPLSMPVLRSPQQFPLPPATPPQEAQKTTNSPQLPLAQAVLFSSGVGYFQREGVVEGTARVDLSFPVRDINDLLKSMVVRDLDGG